MAGVPIDPPLVDAARAADEDRQGPEGKKGEDENDPQPAAQVRLPAAPRPAFGSTIMPGPR